MKKIYYTILFFVLTFFQCSFVEGATIDNPIKAKTIQQLIEEVLKIVVAVGTPIAVLFLIYSGFKFVFAQGNSDKLGEAREMFLWTIVGIAILLGAQLLSTIVKGTIDQLKTGL